jgi:hypothetical protein
VVIIQGDKIGMWGEVKIRQTVAQDADEG